MKKLVLMTAIAVGAAYADIVPNLDVGPGAITCALNLCTFQYSATIHSGTMVTGANDETDFFTIYDFNGYVPGSAIAPADWTVSLVSLTPSLINLGANDDAAIPNLTFIYTGAADIKNGNTISGFSAKSFFGPATITEWYASQAHKQGDTPGGAVQDVGPTQVPSPLQNEGNVPEPFSWSLMGGGLIALAVIPRRLKK